MTPEIASIAASGGAGLVVSINRAVQRMRSLRVATAGRGQSMHGGIFDRTDLDNGGSIVTSRGGVNPNDVATEVNSEMYRGNGQVDIISGVHGEPSGDVRIDNAMFEHDVEKFGGADGVTVHNYTDLSESEISNLLNNPNTTIGGVCNSGACLLQNR